MEKVYELWLQYLKKNDNSRSDIDALIFQFGVEESESIVQKAIDDDKKIVLLYNRDSDDELTIEYK